MIKLKHISLLVTLASSLFMGSVQAGDSRTIHGESYMNGESLDLSGLEGAVDRAAESRRGPAPGISYFEVYAVGSSNVGWEYPQSWQSITTHDHGGSQLRVAVLQIGYGNNNNATLNALSVSDYDEWRLCGSDLHICNVGETIVGWLYFYAFDGQQGGYFTNSASSTASPFGYWSDSISIR